MALATLRQWVSGAFIAVALGANAACTKPPEPPAATHTVQGVVKLFPAATKPGNGKTIVVLHQAIPKFKDQEGKEVGMVPMPMPFTISSGVDVSGIALGSKVEMTFGVFWKEPNPTRILAIKKLPDDAKIKFDVDE